MKKLKQYHTFLNENSSVMKITVDDLEKLLNNQTITINGVSIKNEKNIFLYDMVQLAQGIITPVQDCNCKIILEDGVDFKTVRNIVRNSTLNKEGALFGVFIETHPMRGG